MNVRALPPPSLLAELPAEPSGFLHDVGLIAAVQCLAEDLETNHGLVVKIIEELELDE